jgi:membrane protein implicated in regulation of membrane protease activity
MTTDWIFGWWNLVFIAPFAVALIYLGVYAGSGLTFGDADTDSDADVDHDADIDADADVDADADADVDAEHDIDADHDVDADHDADTDTDADGDSETAGGQSSSILAALSWLGVGRVPLSIILMVLLLSWGAIGFAVNVICQPQVSQAWRAALFSLPLALIGSVAVTSGVSGLVVRYVPLHESSARRRHELLGCVGEAVFAIDESSGVVAVRDEDGNLFQVSGRVAQDAAPIPKGSRVKLVSYRAAGNVFTAQPLTAK